MNRTDFVKELWILYEKAVNSSAFMDALAILKEICNHEPREQ